MAAVLRRKHSFHFKLITQWTIVRNLWIDAIGTELFHLAGYLSTKNLILKQILPSLLVTQIRTFSVTLSRENLFDLIIGRLT